MVQSKQPSTPRMASWRAAEEPSSERPTRVDAVGFELGEDFDGELGGGGGSDGDGEAEAAGFVDEVVDVGALQRIAAGEDEVRLGVEGCDLAEQGEALGVGELVGMRGGDGFGAAVAAGERAGLGHLPVDEHGIAGVVVMGGAMCVRVGRCGGCDGSDIDGIACWCSPRIRCKRADVRRR